MNSLERDQTLSASALHRVLIDLVIQVGLLSAISQSHISYQHTEIQHIIQVGVWVKRKVWL